MLEILLSAKLQEIWYIPVVLHNKLRSFREFRISPRDLAKLQSQVCQQSQAVQTTAIANTKFLRYAACTGVI